MDRDLNPQEVRELQHLLNRAGYSIHADGVFGKELRDALSAWQRRVGMRDDGSPTYEVFERLRRDFDGHFAPPEAEAPPEWVKVERGQNREPGYVQLSKTKPVKFEVKSLAINYNAGQPSGIETVSSESIQMVKKILSHPDTVAIGALEITGKTYYGRGAKKTGSGCSPARRRSWMRSASLDTMSHELRCRLRPQKSLKRKIWFTSRWAFQVRRQPGLRSANPTKMRNHALAPGSATHLDLRFRPG